MARAERNIAGSYMLISDYCDFVDRSDWTKDHELNERQNIAQYGIASETGSLVSAVKKQLLTGGVRWNEPTDEIIEELGDVVWYAAMLANLGQERRLTDILKFDFESLQSEIYADAKFKASLDAESFEEFIRLSNDYIDSFDTRQFVDYQEIAFLTSRTRDKELLHVCLTRLLFYGTIMLSKGFPYFEKILQEDILDLPLDRALGMIMWHVSAVAKLYGKTLDEIVEANVEKINELFNLDNEPPTPLHDDGSEVPDSQRMPRKFAVSFVSVGPSRLQMYYNGSRLGDELTDNSPEDDGYRFHDIMHLANAAKLGWSPVLRALMKRKRKYDPVIDNAQDGARAQIVEEAVVKAIHSEGARIGGAGHQPGSGPARLFTSKEQIPFGFLKLIKSFVSSLEVSKNRIWEWQEAIVEGHRIYSALHAEKQGTVSVDLNHRTISFNPHVAPALKGAVVGTGLGQADFGGAEATRLTPEERNSVGDDAEKAARLAAQKGAILRALGLSPEKDSCFSGVRISDFSDGISVKATGEVQKAMWNKGAVSFQSVDMELEKGVLCYAIALGDIPG